MPLSETQTDQIRKFAHDHYRKLDQTHGIEHLNRTVKLAIYLAKKEGANTDIVKVGAMLHQLHDAGTVRKFLEEIELDENLIKEIVHCVECCRVREIAKAKTIEAKVVYDADKLQVLGPFGIMREISCNMVPPRSMTFRDALKNTIITEQKCFETLQTETAKKLAKQPHEYVVGFWKILDKWDKVKF